MRQPGSESVYEAASLWVTRCLRTDGSLFTPGEAIWSFATADELYRHYNLQPDESGDSFETKLKRQIEGASVSAFQLAAEALYVLHLIPNDISGKAKRAGIEKVLGWMPQPVEIPEELGSVLDRGLLSGGLGFKTLKWAQFATLVDFARSWKELPERDRVLRLEDPWNFRSFLWQLEVTTGQAMRETLLHLVFPDTFEDIVSHDHKVAIAKAFAERVSDATADVDRQLLDIRTSFGHEFGGWFSFYDPDLNHIWKQDDERERWDALIHWAARFRESFDLDTDERTPKLEGGHRLASVRASLRSGSDSWSSQLRREFKRLGNIVHFVQAARFLDWVDSRPDEAETTIREAWTDEGDPLVHLVPLAAAAKEHDFDFLSVGSVLMMAMDATRYPPVSASAVSKGLERVGEPKAMGAPSEVKRYRRALGLFDRFGNEARKRELAVRDRLDSQTLLWAALRYEPPDDWSAAERRAFEAWRETGDTHFPNGNGNGNGPPRDPLESLARSLYLPAGFLEDVVRLLERRKQIVLYGPPGTGKTFIGRALAEYLAKDRVDIVQFHPSYSYEDFVWGYRPVLQGDTLTYRLEDGPLKRAAESARDGQVRVLLIDEINRGNLPKILGELLYLLEYRDDEVRLMYSPENSAGFRLPENLLIIGTMNTADRSVGLIDAALRRRFAFIQLFPGREPLTDTLADWLEDHRPDMKHVARILDALNEKLVQRLGSHLQVGPSHFFRDDLSVTVLEEIWRHDVMPFLQDQLYGHEDELSEFELARLIEEIGADAESDGMAADDGTTDG